MKIAMNNLTVVRRGVKEVASKGTRVYHELTGSADALDLFKRDVASLYCKQGTVSDEGKCFLWTDVSKKLLIGANILRKEITNPTTGEAYVLYKGDGLTPRTVRDRAMQLLKHTASYAQALDIADYELNEEAWAANAAQFEQQSEQQEDNAPIDGLETPTTAPKRRGGRPKKSA